MVRKSTIIVGKAVQRLAKRRGGGTALPGLIAEAMEPGFLPGCLSKLPHGVIVVTGTNGKTTTTKIIAELLSGLGLRVFTNRTGSNFTRGIAAAVLENISLRGEFDFDVAVLELDEAHAVRFVGKVRPSHVLVLNVARDQLDRFGEIDHTAGLVAKVTASATKGVVLNGDDERLVGIASRLKETKVSFFGISPALGTTFASDDRLYHGSQVAAGAGANDVELLELNGQTARYRLGAEVFEATLRLGGAYNFLNAAAAMAMVSQTLPGKVSADFYKNALAKIQPAFGRGEKILINGRELELVLVKNPSGFRLALSSYDHTSATTMIVINDRFADGRDVSWLWDVDFTVLGQGGVAIVAGTRAYDMALRLRYDEVRAGAIEPKIKPALSILLNKSQSKMRIFCTYTAMLELRRILGKTASLKSFEA